MTSIDRKRKTRNQRKEDAEDKGTLSVAPPDPHAIEECISSHKEGIPVPIWTCGRDYGGQGGDPIAQCAMQVRKWVSISPGLPIERREPTEGDELKRLITNDGVKERSAYLSRSSPP